MSLTLHKVGVFSEDEENHVFTFVLDNVQKFVMSPSDVRGLESSEVNYGGHAWSVVCARKEDHYTGIFLKWRYADGPSLSSVSVKVKYSLTLIHRQDYAENIQFTTTQRFSSGQTLLGKSKMIPVSDLLDHAAGFVDDTGKQVVIELSFTSCSTHYEKIVDISPPMRTRKNASGIYFDTSTFLLAGHRWYLRFYAKKMNSNGLPAVYLYLSSKSKGVAIDLQFTLFLGKDFTEILNYAFGDDAKFEGFGKTLPDPLTNVDRLTEVTVGVDIQLLAVTKTTPVRLVHRPTPYTVTMSRGPSMMVSSQNGAMTSSVNASDTFQDHDGNIWKTEVIRDRRWLTVSVDKGVHHFTNNRTRIIIWSAVLLSRDIQRAADVCMKGYPVVGYFSNFIDEKGYLITFPVQPSELEDRSSPFVDETGSIIVRFNMLSIQSTPLTLRSVPRFDYQQQHLLKARQELRAIDAHGLQESRDMSASRGSLSLLDEMNTLSVGLNGHSSANYKSCESLDRMSTSDSATFGEDVFRPFVRSLLRVLNDESGSRSEQVVLTSRDLHAANGSSMSESSSTESGLAANWNEDSMTLFTHARINPVDSRNYPDVVSSLVKFIKNRVPLRITSVVELGSYGTGTVTRSRADVDIILVSPDVPRDCQGGWLPALLQAIKCQLQMPSNVDQPQLPARCTGWHLTSHAVQFTCAGLDVDVMVTSDWNVTSEPVGYDALYEVTCKQTTTSSRQWYSLACAQLQKRFLIEQPNEVKELIKVFKHWRNGVQWRKLEYRPNSYLLSLLVIKAVDETRVVDVRQIIQRVGVYILSSELRLSWNTFYKADLYEVEFSPPTPLVRDPTNPGVNVAETLTYWGQLRTEYSQWLRSFNISLSRVTS